MTKRQLDRDKIERTSRIVSHTQGTVTQILTADDEYVREGAPVVLLSSPKETGPGPDDAGTPFECIVFVPAGEGKKIDVGNFVEVMPATIKREEHGFIHGAVVATLVTGLVSVFNLGLLFWYSWRLALISVFLVGIMLAVIAVLLAGQPWTSAKSAARSASFSSTRSSCPAIFSTILWASPPG